MNMKLKLILAMTAALAFGAAQAKLPPPNDEAKAKAAEAGEKAAHGNKVAAYQLCKSQNRTVERYMKELAIPYFAAKDGGAHSEEELFASANLYSQEAGLRDDPRISVFTNQDDFILKPGDLDWLSSVFAGRITVFPGGGHLGNLFMPEVQAAFMEGLGSSENVAAAP